MVRINEVQGAPWPMINVRIMLPKRSFKFILRDLYYVLQGDLEKAYEELQARIKELKNA